MHPPLTEKRRERGMSHFRGGICSELAHISCIIFPPTSTPIGYISLLCMLLSINQIYESKVLYGGFTLKREEI